VSRDPDDWPALAGLPEPTWPQLLAAAGVPARPPMPVDSLPVTGLPPACSRGHHCGIRSAAEGGYSYEGHCGCPECHCPLYVVEAEIVETDRQWPLCGPPTTTG
jgi:hypothetical protein